MRGWFRSRKPATHVTQLSREELADLLTASAWDLTPDQWAALGEQERRYRRLNITHAPRFAAGASR